MKICKLPGGSISFDEDGSVQPHDYGGWLGPHIPLIAGIGFILRMKEELKEKLLEEAVNFYGDKNLKDLERLHAACTCYWLTGGNGVHFHFTGDQGVETIDSYELENITYELKEKLPPGYYFDVYGHGKSISETQADKYMDEVQEKVQKWIDSKESITITDIINQVNEWYENDEIDYQLEQFLDWIEQGYYQYCVDLYDNYPNAEKRRRLCTFYYEGTPSFESESFLKELKEELDANNIEWSEHSELLELLTPQQEPVWNKPFELGETVRNIETGELEKVVAYSYGRSGGTYLHTDKTQGFVLQYERVKNE